MKREVKTAKIENIDLHDLLFYHFYIFRKEAHAWPN